MACSGVPELHDMELESEKPEEKKPKLMMSGVEDSSDADDVSPKVIYSSNSDDDVSPAQFLSDLAVLSIDAFNKRNSACLKCTMVQLVKVTSQACNGLLLNLEVAARHTNSPDAKPHIFNSKIWYKPGLVPNADDVLLVSASPSFIRSLITRLVSLRPEHVVGTEAGPIIFTRESHEGDQCDGGCYVSWDGIDAKEAANKIMLLSMALTLILSFHFKSFVIFTQLVEPVLEL